MKLLKGLLAFVGFVVLLAVFAAGYFGYIPAVSSLLGTNKPKDLGVTYTEIDLASAKDKFNVNLVTLPEGSVPNIRYEGSHEVDTSFTQAELTAMVNSKKYAYSPVRDVQIKINDDGTVESSGILRVDNLADYFTSVDGGSVDTAEVNKYIGYLPSEVPYYISAAVSVSGGTVSLETTGFQIGTPFSLVNTAQAASTVTGTVSEFKAGPFSFDQSQISTYQGQINSFLTARLAAISGLRIDSVTFGGGKMDFKGAMPDKKYRVVEE